MNSGTPKIKVCGMRDKNNLEQLAGLQPDYIGFILYPKSKRYLGDNYTLEAFIPGTIKRVGIFVNAQFDTINLWNARLQLNLLQLHGSETPEYCEKLHNMGYHIIKAFGVDEQFDFQILRAYQPWCTYFLFDTKVPDHGGSGLQFNWNLLKAYTLNTPVILSGGIGPNDVEAIKKIKSLPLHAIDINSKFEDAPALKNILKLNHFISEIRN